TMWASGIIIGISRSCYTRLSYGNGLVGWLEDDTGMGTEHPDGK
ncbi:4301_t:CDS:1, partial [Paraglomus occultum]